jgi:putative membrane protein
MTRIQLAAFAALAVLFLASLFRAPFPDQMYLQHIPTVLAFVACPFLLKRFPLSDQAFFCLAVFLSFHTVAARYIYSYVPYDRWSQSLFGFSITETFALRRNHFDRLVHFSFGALFVRPIWEICVRYFDVRRRFAYYVAFEFVLAISMLYELFEWGLTVVLAGQDADAYNGQQGDIWDAQKDMACALVGALVSLIILYFTRRRRQYRSSLQPIPADGRV